VHASSQVERLLGGLPPHCRLVTVLDGHPATLGWLGALVGHRTRTLGVEHFGQTGTIADLYRHHGIDPKAILPPPKPSRRIGRSGCCALCPDRRRARSRGGAGRHLMGVRSMKRFRPSHSTGARPSPRRLRTLRSDVPKIYPTQSAKAPFVPCSQAFLCIRRDR
jgi:hypothetical protein